LAIKLPKVKNLNNSIKKTRNKLNIKISENKKNYFEDFKKTLNGENFLCLMMKILVEKE
jgi:hypothetical protein